MIKKVPWESWELDALREAWPRGAMKAAQEALPHRPENSIRGKVERLGLKLNGREPYRKQPSSEWIDAALRRAYRSPMPRLDKLAKELNRTKGWIKWRAGILGIRHIADKHNRKWETEEDQILEEGLERGNKVSTIHRILRKAGYFRSLTAIQNRVYTLQLGFNRKGWSATEVAGLFDIDPGVVVGWINKGWLSASREVGPSCGKYPDEIEERRKMHMITADNLKKFMLSYPRAWDHRRMRIEILLDLLCGNQHGFLFSAKAVVGCVNET